jgi:hypothetical protein
MRGNFSGDQSDRSEWPRNAAMRYNKKDEYMKAKFYVFYQSNQAIRKRLFVKRIIIAKYEPNLIEHTNLAGSFVVVAKVDVIIVKETVLVVL